MSEIVENIRDDNSTNYSLTQQPQIITPFRLGVIILLLFSIMIGTVAFVIDPLIILGVLFAIMFGILIFLYPYFGLLCYFAILVIKPGAFVPQLAVLHPERILAGLLIVSLLINKKLKHQKVHLFDEKMNWLFALFILVMLLSVPLSFWPSKSIQTIINFLKTCAFYFFIINLIDSEKKLIGFLWLSIIATGYSAISSAIAYFSGNLVVAQGIERAESLTGTDPNTLAVSLVLSLPFLLFSMGWIKNKWLKIFPLFCSVCAIFTISLTGSRSGVLGLLAVFFFIWLTLKNKFFIAIVCVFMLIGCWFILPDQYQERYSSIVSSDYDPSTEGRFEAWEAGLNMFLTRPLFGVGAGTFGVAHASGQFSARRSWLAAHNMYIQIIAEIGFFGLLAFGYLVYYMLRQNFRLRKLFKKLKIKNDLLNYLSYSITCSTGALFITSFFGHSLFRGNWYRMAALTVVIWYLVDKIIAKKHQRKNEDANGIRRALS